MASISLCFVQFVSAAPFFAEKEHIRFKSTEKDPIKKDIELNTFYRVNKIVGTDMLYNKYIYGDLVEVNTTGTVAAFDDTMKYEKIDVSFPVGTLFKNASGTLEWTYKYFSPLEAKLDLGSDFFEFNPIIKGSVVRIIRSLFAKEINK